MHHQQSRDPDSVWDVVVIGAGPAGASAALAAASASQRVLLLERAAIPRYKTCGGGLVAASMMALQEHLAVPTQANITTFTFSLGGRWSRTRRASQTALTLVCRDEFDAALVRAAKGAGTTVYDQVLVQGLDQDDHGVRITTLQHGQLTAKIVVGADGTAGRTAGHVGVRYAQVDLGLEVELPTPPEQAAAWQHRVLIDWGRMPGAYGWVFPKGDTLSIGVIGARGDGAGARSYLAAFLVELGLGHVAPLVKSGHLTRCRTDDSPLFRGRVLVAGDAAGLLEPWTREGISFALRSGRMAGEAATIAAGADDPAEISKAMEGYATAIAETLSNEMQAGRLFMTAFTRHPWLFHAIIGLLPPAWQVFLRILRHETTFAQVARHRVVRIILRVLS